MSTRATGVPIERPEDFVPVSLDRAENSLVTLIEEAAERHPARVAARAHGQGVTYESLNERANAQAYAILARCGRGAEPITLMLGHDVEAVIALLAILKAGRPYLALNRAYPLDRIKLLLADSGSPLILTDANNLHYVEPLTHDQKAVGVLDISQIESSSQRGNLGLRVNPGEPAYIAYTSGSTGEPKGVVKSHRHVAFDTLVETNERLLSPSDRISLLSAVSFAASRAAIYGALFNGATVCMYDVNADGANAAVNWLQSEGVTVFRSTVPVFRAIFSSAPARTRFSSLRFIGVGGDRVHPQDLSLYRAHTLHGCAFMSFLSSSECGTLAQYCLGHDTLFEGDVLPVGYPFEGKEIILVHENGAPVGKGEKGEVLVRSRYLSSGYWGRPGLTASRFRPDPSDPAVQTYLTGDLARWNSDGALEYLGRKDSMVKIRGYRVELSEIEAALYQYPLVKEVVVVARPQPRLSGEKRLVAYVVPVSGKTLNQREVRSFLGGRLPAYMVPSLFVALERMPLNTSGKPDLKALPELEGTRPNLSGEYVQGRSDLETELVGIWEDLLDVRPVGVHDDFFELGGDSLTAVALMAEIETRLGIPCPPSVLLEAATVEQLAALLARGKEPPPASVLVPLQPRGTRPPLFLAHGLGGGVVFYRRLAGHLGEDQPVYGVQSPVLDDPRPGEFETAIVRYVDEVLAVQPAGPFYLGGYSYGAAVAYEMAQHLLRRGHEVALLAVIDFAPDAAYRRPVLNARFAVGFLKNLPYWFTGYVRRGRRGMVAKLNLKLGKAFASLRAGEDVMTGLSRLGIEDFLVNLDQATPEHRISMEQRFRALREHRLEPYPGRITLFSARAQPFICSFDPEMHWGELALGGVEVRRVAGAHHDMLREPHVRELAREMGDCLAKAQARPHEQAASASLEA